MAIVLILIKTKTIHLLPYKISRNFENDQCNFKKIIKALTISCGSTAAYFENACYMKSVVDVYVKDEKYFRPVLLVIVPTYIKYISSTVNVETPFLKGKCNSSGSNFR